MSWSRVCSSLGLSFPLLKRVGESRWELTALDLCESSPLGRFFVSYLKAKDPKFSLNSISLLSPPAFLSFTGKLGRSLMKFVFAPSSLSILSSAPLDHLSLPYHLDNSCQIHQLLLHNQTATHFPVPSFPEFPGSCT